jgi:hypothetical protein
VNGIAYYFHRFLFSKNARRWRARTEPRAAESGDKIAGFSPDLVESAWERTPFASLWKGRGGFGRPFFRFTVYFHVTFLFLDRTDTRGPITTDRADTPNLANDQPAQHLRSDHRASSPRVFSPSLAAFMTRRFHFYERRARATSTWDRIGAVFTRACARSFAIISDQWNFWPVLHTTVWHYTTYISAYLCIDYFGISSLFLSVSPRDWPCRDSEDLERLCSHKVDTFFKSLSSNYPLWLSDHQVRSVWLIDIHKKTRESATASIIMFYAHKISRW